MGQRSLCRSTEPRQRELGQGSSQLGAGCWVLGFQCSGGHGRAYSPHSSHAFGSGGLLLILPLD